MLKQPHSLFISDLHLCAARPHTGALLQAFLRGPARDAEALYILGDLFEYWAGDDDLESQRDTVQALKSLHDSGTALFLMHGNRDFLIGLDFARAAGVTLLEDPCLLSCHGHRVLLSHGDTLCTDDVAYQQFRSQVRDPQWQSAFLAQPLATRKQQIAALREKSQSEKSGKMAEIMDVNPDAVQSLLRAHDYPALLIHGHTHRPACHPTLCDGHACDRWVLSDWDHSGSYLRLDRDGVSVHPVHAAAPY